MCKSVRCLCLPISRIDHENTTVLLKYSNNTRIGLCRGKSERVSRVAFFYHTPVEPWIFSFWRPRDLAGLSLRCNFGSSNPHSTLTDCPSLSTSIFTNLSLSLSTKARFTHSGAAQRSSISQVKLPASIFSDSYYMALIPDFDVRSITISTFWFFFFFPVNCSCCFCPRFIYLFFKSIVSSSLEVLDLFVIWNLVAIWNVIFSWSKTWEAHFSLIF